MLQQFLYPYIQDDFVYLTVVTVGEWAVHVIPGVSQMAAVSVHGGVTIPVKSSVLYLAHRQYCI